MTEYSKRVGAIIQTTAFRHAAATGAVFLTLSAILIGVLFWQTNRVLTEQVIATLSAEAEALRAESNAGNSPTMLIEAVTARSRPEGPGLYFLADATGRKLAGNLSRSPPEIVDMKTGGVFKYRPSTVAEGRERMGVAIALVTPRNERLIIGRDVDDQRAFADGVKWLFIGSFGILALAALGTALLVSRSVLKRIEAMNVASRQIMAGDFSRRVPLAGSGDELDGLAGNLNAMLDRIEQLMAGLREVSENIAHDLKTPLNRLRNRVEGALREPAGDTTHREALERTIEEADELIKTFNALLLIARLESSALDKSAETVDCGVLVRDVAELYAPVAEEAGITLEVGVQTGAMIRANRQLIGQAVANLIDNAIKYAPAGHRSRQEATVHVDVVRQDTSVEIIVADRGPGIAVRDRERALKRFVRLDESRTQPGTGLGLSLVAGVARLHGGRVILEDHHPGLKVRVVLPQPPLVDTGPLPRPRSPEHSAVLAAAAGGAKS